MLKNISFVNIDLRITETPFLCLKSSSRLHFSTFGIIVINKFRKIKRLLKLILVQFITIFSNFISLKIESYLQLLKLHPLLV